MILSGLRRKSALHWSQRTFARQTYTASGSGQEMLGGDEVGWEEMLSPGKTMGPCTVQLEQPCGGVELRQENAFTQRAVYVASSLDCQECSLREQCLGRGAKGNRARRVSAVRRLLPASSSVEPQPGLLRATRWVDVAGRKLRRTWTAHWRQQHLEVIPLKAAQQKTSPPPRSPRAIRSRRRWSWHDRLARNTWWGPPRQRVTVAGVPSFLDKKRDEAEMAN